MKASFALAMLVIAAFSTPALASSYQIYFPQNATTLTPEAKTVADAFAQNVAHDNPSAITIVGHSDTAENSRTLSLKRAQAVVAELLKDGMSKSIKVSVSGVGASDLAVPTPPKSHEPLNRFVTVSY